MANLYDQIPKDGYPKAPTADGSQNNPLNTEVGRNLSNLASAIPGAAGVPGAVAMGTGLAARALGASAPAVGLAGRAFQAAAPYAPVAAGAVALNSATSASSAPPQAAPTAPSITPQTDVQRGGGNVPAVAPPSPNPAAPSPAATGDEIAPGVYRHGRGQYSDNAAGMGMPANFTGQPNAQNMAAGDSLAARSQQASMAQQSTGFQPQGVTAPTVLNSSNSWQARNDLRNLEVSAKSITNNGGQFDPTKGRNPAQAAYLSALQADAAARGAQPGLDAVAMRENAGIQREGMQQTGETARTGMREQGANARESGRSILARDEFNLRKEASSFQTRAAQQQEQLRNVLLDQKATPEQRAVAQRNLAAMMGKGEENRFTVVPGGQEWDQAAGAMRNVPARALNNQTGRFVEQAQGGAGGAQPLPNHVAALQANPGQAAQFDDIYGPGAAARALGR